MKNTAIIETEGATFKDILDGLAEINLDHEYASMTMGNAHQTVLLVEVKKAKELRMIAELARKLKMQDLYFVCGNMKLCMIDLTSLEKNEIDDLMPLTHEQAITRKVHIYRIPDFSYWGFVNAL